jgi:hypothetical protein
MIPGKEESTSRVYHSQEDRDKALEERYHYDKSVFDAPPWASTLSIVASFRDRFREEFRCWWQINRGPIKEQLPKWENERFGAPLVDAAHGLLLFHITRDPEERQLREPGADE